MIPDLIPRTAWEEPGWTVDEHTSSGPHPYTRTYAASPDDIGDWVEHNQWRRV